jgi:MEMO1 family protein
MTEQNQTIRIELDLSPQSLAAASVQIYLRDRTILPTPEQLPEYLNIRAATFVSIKTGEGRLRGCIGSIEPIYPNAAIEIINNAIKAATTDYRFEPVRVDELDQLIYSVDILSTPEPFEDLSEHDPKIFGLIIETLEGKRGVLLPDLEGINTAEAQLSALRRKIGLQHDSKIRMSRFRVSRYGRK